ncbi:MAG TPA: hypothetical protein VFQ96_02225, partial [Microbacteriaceae bacterium]|nr:hypothetical protein [Microbacteriaceae bacterium]
NALTHPDLSFRIADRDEAGANALTRLHGRGVNLVAGALARSTDHILSFFTMLRDELGFYVGCIRAAAALEEHDLPVARPDVRPAGGVLLDAHGLFDVALAVMNRTSVVGNDVAAADDDLIVITGVNSGGKSTLLRAIGQAQLMAQCGMFVPAASLTAAVRHGVFTHFKREEDDELTGGKLDEELARMSAIADQLASGALVLFNESFASTNEKEGSEIARQVVHALIRRGVKAVYVTHMYDLAHGLATEAEGGRARALFLRAEPARDFRLVEGTPLPTSHGSDLYTRVFGRSPADNDERTTSCATSPSPATAAPR